MHKTADYVRVNGELQKVTHLIKQQKSWTVISLKQHLANVSIYTCWIWWLLHF